MKSLRLMSAVLATAATLLFLLMTQQVYKELRAQILFSTVPICKTDQEESCIVREHVSIQTRSVRDEWRETSRCIATVTSGSRHFEVTLGSQLCFTSGHGVASRLSTSDQLRSVTIDGKAYGLNHSEFTLAWCAVGMWLCMAVFHSIVFSERPQWPRSLHPLVIGTGLPVAATLGFVSARQPAFIIALGVFMAVVTLIERLSHRPPTEA